MLMIIDIHVPDQIREDRRVVPMNEIPYIKGYHFYGDDNE
jgi:hypothetical protein